MLRRGADQWEPGVLALLLSFGGAAISGLTGRLGGELVERLGVGVDEDAGLDAPNTLSRGKTAGGAA